MRRREGSGGSRPRYGEGIGTNVVSGCWLKKERMLDGMEKIKIVTYDYFLNNEGRLISRFLFKIDELYLRNLLYTQKIKFCLFLQVNFILRFHFLSVN